MKKIYLKKKKKRKNIIITLILIFILIASLLQIVLRYINKNISPELIEYASIEIKKISNIIISKAITQNEIEKFDTNNLFIITKNEKNEILTVDLNTTLINKIVFQITDKIQENLKQLEQGKINEYNENSNGVILKIPIGLITKNFMLNELGPKIPVKMKILGNMDSNINTKITNYGINNALIETYIEISITEQVILPITTKKINITSKIPIAIKLINGTVPNYYPNGIIERRYDEKI